MFGFQPCFFQPTLLTIQKINDDNPGGIWEDVHIFIVEIFSGSDFIDFSGSDPRSDEGSYLEAVNVLGFFGAERTLQKKAQIQLHSKQGATHFWGQNWVLGSYETHTKKICPSRIFQTKKAA